MKARLRSWLPALAAGAGHAVRLGSQVLPGAAGVVLTSAGVGLWLHELGAGLTVAGVLLLADRVATGLWRGEGR